MEKPWKCRMVLAILAVPAFFQLGCRMDMHDQPRYETYEKSDFFEDGRASRIPPEGTVARRDLRQDELYYTGRMNGTDSEVFPFPVTETVLRRGQERYDIYCSPCHDRVGTGRGIIVQRGMKQPPSFHIVRLKEAPVGYFFNVITNGYGVMFSYSSRVSPEDRWSIAAYIRALQLSQGASYGDVPDEDLQRVETAASGDESGDDEEETAN